MGDSHFVLRHALAGGVLILFILNGMVLFHYNLAVKFIAWLTGGAGNITNFSAVIGLAASAPIIGVGIQGIHLAWRLYRKTAFTDNARQHIAKRVIENIISKDKLPHLDNGEVVTFVEIFRKLPADSIFVWLYHTDCPPHLIEWARRRRSYSYLGYNWATAGIIGLAMGALIVALVKDQSILSPSEQNIFNRLNRSGIQLFVCIFSIVWIWGCVYLGSAMKKDVDAMELAWVYGKIHPGIKIFDI